MNRRTLGLAFAVISLGSVAIVPPALADDTADVAAQLERLRLAMIARDKPVLEDIMADELTYGHSDRRVQTKAEMIGAIMSGFSQFKSITLSDEKIQIVGDVAVARLRFVAETVSNGKQATPDLRLVFVFIKRGGAWKLLVRQAH
jgi:putative N-acetylmannosamine-6-phosphate epimerase